MTDTKELRERLRRHEGIGAALAHDRGQTGRFVAAVMDEAASAIERLEASNAALMAERTKLAEALRPFLGDETMEGLLWGDLPDDATGTVTVRLGFIRAARTALASLEKKPDAS